MGELLQVSIANQFVMSLQLPTSLHDRYYLEKFDWKRDVVTIRQLEQLSKLEKEWASKRACIEGETIGYEKLMKEYCFL